MRLPAFTPGRFGVLAVLLGALPQSMAAQESIARLQVVPGMTLLSRLHFAEGDRENVVEVTSADSSGVRYGWRLPEVRQSGEPPRRVGPRLLMRWV